MPIIPSISCMVGRLQAIVFRTNVYVEKVGDGQIEQKIIVVFPERTD